MANNRGMMDAPASSTARTGMGPKSQKEQNEDFFARKGSENANRPDGIAPNQGGKYSGFGSDPTPAAPRNNTSGSGAMPGVNDFQQDPMAALSKGFWGFAGAVGKGAKSLNEGYIQPTAQKVRQTFYPSWYRQLQQSKHKANESFPNG